MKLYLSDKGAYRVRRGHPWVFSRELESSRQDREIPGGSAVHLYDRNEDYLAFAHYESQSKVACRVLSRQREPDEKELLERRILAAFALRSRVIPPSNSGCRLIHGEGDMLPGLIADSFGDYLLLELHSQGMVQRRKTLAKVFDEHLAPKGMILKTFDSQGSFELEILKDPPPSPLQISLDGLQLLVDLQGGRKKGHFYDQGSNRKKFTPLLSGYKVLDTFCYNGAWGLSAAYHGALEIEFLDHSKENLQLIEASAELNGVMERCSFVEDDVLSFLKGRAKGSAKYDAIILDPPALASSIESKEEGMKEYLRLSRESMACLHPGGFLISSSCSRFLTMEEFTAIINKAASQRGRFAKIVGQGSLSPDHPLPSGLPEANYLKCLLLEVD